MRKNETYIHHLGFVLERPMKRDRSQPDDTKCFLTSALALGRRQETYRMSRPGTVSEAGS